MPALFLIFGVFLAMAALCVFLLTLSPLPNANQLRTVSGSIAYAPYLTREGKQGDRLHILVRADNGLYDLSPQQLIYGVRGLQTRMMRLHVGDKVTVQVEHDSLGRGDTQIWELQHDSTTILSYRDSRLFFDHRDARNRGFAHATALLAFIVCLAGILLRKHFGAWQDKNKA